MGGLHRRQPPAVSKVAQMSVADDSEKDKLSNKVTPFETARDDEITWIVAKWSILRLVGMARLKSLSKHVPFA